MNERRSALALVDDLDPATWEIRGTALGIGLPWAPAESLDMGFRESFSPTAFAVQQRNGFRDVVGLWQHEAARLLCSVNAGTMSVKVASDGLRYSMKLPDSAELYQELLDRGDVMGASISFREADAEWSVDSNGAAHRFVKSATLLEISLVTWPAYPQTTAVGSRSSVPPALELVRAPATRVGKKISAASAEQIKSAVDALLGLLESEEPDGDEPTVAVESNGKAPAMSGRPGGFSLIDLEMAARCRELGIRTAPVTWMDAAMRLHEINGRQH